MRKTLGSKKSQLVTQFVFESILMTLLSVIIACVVVSSLLPGFNALVEKDISFAQMLKPGFVIGAGLLALVVGLLSGFYPAFILSSFKAVKY